MEDVGSPANPPDLLPSIWFLNNKKFNLFSDLITSILMGKNYNIKQHHHSCSVRWKGKASKSTK
jgi:hypothetical protein